MHCHILAAFLLGVWTGAVLTSAILAAFFRSKDRESDSGCFDYSSYFGSYCQSVRRRESDADWQRRMSGLPICTRLQSGGSDGCSAATELPSGNTSPARKVEKSS
jgi:hypothetical protein